MQVTLAKALKVKNQVAGKLVKLQHYVQQHNRVIEVNKDAYKVSEKCAEYLKLQHWFIRLKQEIARANVGIQSAIVELAETKGLLSFWQNVPTDTAVVQRYGYDDKMTEDRYAVTISEAEKEQAIKDCEKRIVELQDQLDTFNAITKIEIDDSLVA